MNALLFNGRQTRKSNAAVTLLMTLRTPTMRRRAMLDQLFCEDIDEALHGKLCYFDTGGAASVMPCVGLMLDCLTRDVMHR